MLNSNSNCIELRDNRKEIRLRRSLFWDIPEKVINLQKHKRLIIERVFSRGNIEELRQIMHYYPEDEIRKIVVKIRSLDKKTHNFISRTYRIKPEEFRCSIGK